MSPLDPGASGRINGEKSGALARVRPFPLESPIWSRIMARLVHDRPLVFLDLETTGTYPLYDRIVEISVIKLTPGAETPEIRTRRVHPGRPIPAQATAIHGIRDEDVAEEPRFPRMARSLAHYLEGCDLSGFNLLYFDLPLLRKEFERAGVDFTLEGRRILDVQRLYKVLQPRSLAAAVQHFLEEEHVHAHGAEADAMAAYRVLEGMLERHPDLPQDLEALSRLAGPGDATWVDPEGKLRKSGGRIILGFGKHRGVPLEELARDNPDYLAWILNGDFSGAVKSVVREFIQGQDPGPE